MLPLLPGLSGVYPRYTRLVVMAGLMKRPAYADIPITRLIIHGNYSGGVSTFISPLHMGLPRHHLLCTLATRTLAYTHTRTHKLLDPLELLLDPFYDFHVGLPRRTDQYFSLYIYRYMYIHVDARGN